MSDLPTSVLLIGASQKWEATHQHRNGWRYRVIARGILEANLDSVVIYDDEKGNVWVRPAAEFFDGRFKELTDEHSSEHL